MRHDNKPVLSFIGLFLFLITLIVNLFFRFIGTSDVGLAMLLSVANVVLLVYTLPWSLMAIKELRTFLRAKKSLKSKLEIGSIEKEEYNNESKRLKYCFAINISYFVIIICQLVYVIYNFNDEINI